MQPAPPARAAVRFVSSTANVAAVALRLPTSPLSFAQRQLQPSCGVRARVDVHRRIQIELVTAVGNAVPQFRRQRIAQFITSENLIRLIREVTYALALARTTLRVDGGIRVVWQKRNDAIVLKRPFRIESKVGLFR